MHQRGQQSFQSGSRPVWEQRPRVRRGPLGKGLLFWLRAARGALSLSPAQPRRLPQHTVWDGGAAWPQLLLCTLRAWPVGEAVAPDTCPLPAEGTRRAADGSWAPRSRSAHTYFQGARPSPRKAGPSYVSAPPEPLGCSGRRQRSRAGASICRVAPGEGVRPSTRSSPRGQLARPFVCRLVSVCRRSLPAPSDPGAPGWRRGSGIVQASAPPPPHTACSTQGLSAVLPALAWAEGPRRAPLAPPPEPRSPPAKGLAAQSRQGSALGPSGRPFWWTGVA